MLKRVGTSLLAAVAVVAVGAAGVQMASARASWAQPPGAQRDPADAPSQPPLPSPAPVPQPAPDPTPLPASAPAPLPAPDPAQQPEPISLPQPQAPPYDGPGPIRRVAAEQPTVVLTFDDGPTPFTAPILAILEAQGVPAAFFWLAGSKRIDLAADLIARGHQLGSHTVSHPRLTLMDEQAQREEITRSVLLLEEAGGAPVTFFRPPFAAYDQHTRQIARELGLSFVMWGVDSRDWEAAEPEQIISTVLAKVTPGAVILLHERQQTVEALPQLIQALREAGYGFALLPAP